MDESMVPTVTDNSGVIDKFTYTHRPGYSLAQASRIQFTASDSAGNTGECITNITLGNACEQLLLY